jgi:beta-glucanase (GH16 family)
MTPLATAATALNFALAVAAAAGVAPPGRDDPWTLVWSDDFDGDSVNATNWNVRNNTLHGATELQVYLDEDVFVSGGQLVIRTRSNVHWCVPAGPASSCAPSLPTAPGAVQYNYSSGWLDTKHKVYPKYGKIEVRAQLPDKQSFGVWPAHWLMPEPAVCWPVGGEIDIMESYGNGLQSQWKHHLNGTVFGTYHWAKECGKDLHCGGSAPEHACAPFNFNGVYPPPGAALVDFSANFHVFAVTWNSTSVQWYVDGDKYWERYDGDRPGTDHSAAVDTNPMYIILNTAINPGFVAAPGEPTERVMPVYHKIDYVRVYT